MQNQATCYVTQFWVNFLGKKKKKISKKNLYLGFSGKLLNIWQTFIYFILFTYFYFILFSSRRSDDTEKITNTFSSFSKEAKEEDMWSKISTKNSWRFVQAVASSLLSCRLRTIFNESLFKLTKIMRSSIAIFQLFT